MWAERRFFQKKSLGRARPFLLPLVPTVLVWGCGDRHQGIARIRKCRASEHLRANDLFTSINITVTARAFYVHKPARRYPTGGSQEDLQRAPIHLKRQEVAGRRLPLGVPRPLRWERGSGIAASPPLSPRVPGNLFTSDGASTWSKPRSVLGGTPHRRAPGPGTRFRDTSYAHSIPDAETKNPVPLTGIIIISKSQELRIVIVH